MPGSEKTRAEIQEIKDHGFIPTTRLKVSKIVK